MKPNDYKISLPLSKSTAATVAKLSDLMTTTTASTIATTTTTTTTTAAIPITSTGTVMSSSKTHKSDDDDDDNDDEDFQSLRYETNDKTDDEDDDDDDDNNDDEEDDDDDDEMITLNNTDKKTTYNEGEIIVNMEIDKPSLQQTKTTPPPAAAKRRQLDRKSKTIVNRRQTIDTMDLRKLVLRNNTQNNIVSKLQNSLNMNKNQIIIDYNVLAFLENLPIVESDIQMETRMRKFIERVKENYRGIQYIEYKTDNKLYCALDIVYFLPILFQKAEQQSWHRQQRVQLDKIIKRLDDISLKLSGAVVSATPNKVPRSPQAMKKNAIMAASTPSTTPPPHPSSENPSTEVNDMLSRSEIGGDDDDIDSIASSRRKSSDKANRNIRLYSIGTDFYLMCRKKQNFVDGQKNLEKKYGKCRLLKTWQNRTNVKDIGKTILQKFPRMKWNARTNIISNCSIKEVSETELLNYINKSLK